MRHVEQGQRAVFSYLLQEHALRRTRGTLGGIVGVNGIASTVTVIRGLSYFSYTGLVNRARVHRVETSNESVRNGRARTHEEGIVRL